MRCRRWAGLLLLAATAAAAGELTPEQKQAVEEVKKLGGRVTLDTSGDAPVCTVWLAGSKSVRDDDLKKLAPLPKLHELNLYDTAVTDAGLKHLARLAQLRILYLNHTPVTDAGLVHLARLRGLHNLYLYGTLVSDAGLQHLAGLQLYNLGVPDQACTDLGLKHYLAALQRPVKGLDLAEWPLSDEGLKHLAGLTQLRWLCLNRTLITDAGLKHLTGMTGLQDLNLTATEISPTAAAALKAALPKCKITGP